MMIEQSVNQGKSQDVFALPMNLLMQIEEGRRLLAQIDERLPAILEADDDERATDE